MKVKRTAHEAAELVERRATRLCGAGLLGEQACEKAQSESKVVSAEEESAQKQVDISRFLLDANRSGADLGQDWGSEMTYARQQRDDLTLRLADMQQHLETCEAHVKALEERVNPQPSALKVAAWSRIWSVLSQDGAQVVKGDPLFQVIDCSQLFIFAIVSERSYRKLRIGAKATVVIDGRAYNGSVEQLLGPYGTFTQDRTQGERIKR